MLDFTIYFSLAFMILVSGLVNKIEAKPHSSKQPLDNPATPIHHNIKPTYKERSHAVFANHLNEENHYIDRSISESPLAPFTGLISDVPEKTSATDENPYIQIQNSQLSRRHTFNAPSIDSYSNASARFQSRLFIQLQLICPRLPNSSKE